MDQQKRIQFSKILVNIADALDIPESKYKDAERKYKAVGDWLGKPESSLSPYRPEIYPQGSFRLGTVVKPKTSEDKYDIDLVCQLTLDKNQISQKQLKEIIGNRLKENKIYASMPVEEGRRCWTLNYAESTKFHMDILPAIPDNTDWLIGANVPTAYAQYAIYITDNKKWDLDPDWPRSNPKGYAEWFKSRMKIVFDDRRKYMAEQLRANIEDVPEYKIKTPLQRAIQILKRHRDLVFQNDPDDKPISIIISTLAAKAYNNEPDLLNALTSILRMMPFYIETKSGTPWVTNPVNPFENFADKWAEHPQRAIKFKSWLIQAHSDLNKALESPGLHGVAESLLPVFGEKTVNQAMVKMGDSYRRDRESGKLFMASGTGALGKSGNTPVRDHTFYGT